jgi:hypothetical protein
VTNNQRNLQIPIPLQHVQGAVKAGPGHVQGTVKGGLGGLALEIEYGVPPTPGLSTGSLALLVFFGAGVAPYLLGGMVVRKTRQDAAGWELVPNHSFWSMLPGLVLDGCRFTCACVLRSSVAASVLSMEKRYEAL